MKTGDHAHFVDALRTAMGLEPLYDRSERKRLDVERFGGVPVHGTAGFDSDGGRRVSGKEWNP